jgi:hypothetical protein
MKGLGPVALALVAAFAIIMIEGIILNVFIFKMIGFKESALEGEYISAVNKVEAIKRGLPYALYYSYREALNRAGINDISLISDLSGLEENVTIIFNEYRKKVEERTNVVVPTGKIEIKANPSEVEVSFFSNSLISYSYSSSSLNFVIKENPNVTIKVVNNELIENFY